MIRVNLWKQSTPPSPIEAEVFPSINPNSVEIVAKGEAPRSNPSTSLSSRKSPGMMLKVRVRAGEGYSYVSIQSSEYIKC